MKVILAAKSVFPFHPHGGVQKYVYNFAKFLREEGADVEIIAPLDKAKPRTETLDGIPYTFLWPPIYRYLEYPVGWLGVHMFSIALAQHLKRETFDILHGFDAVNYQYLKMKKRKPAVSQIFTDNYLSNPIAGAGVLGAPGNQAESIKREKLKISPFADAKTVMRYPAQYFLKIKPVHYCLQNAEAVFFEEEMFRKEAAGIFRFDLEDRRYQVMPVGVDVAFIEGALKEPRLSRKDIGLSENDKVLITVNRLAADKGVDKIVLSLTEIAKDIPNVKLIIIGSGYQEKEILNLIACENLQRHVVHLKDVAEKDLYGFYGLSDVYICAFSYPGASISSLEAMACGLPIVTTAQPWLVEGNQNGTVLAGNDPHAIKEAVVDLLKKGNLKQKGQYSKQIAGRYDWGRIAKTAVKRYEEILNRN